MSAHDHAIHRAVRIGVYAILLGLIGWQGWQVACHLRADCRALTTQRFAMVEVAGNVERPGTYRVPEGTTRFELLQVAGVRTTSDVSAIALEAGAEHGSRLDVGTMSSPAGLLLGRHLARLESFFGSISLRSYTGAMKAFQQGAPMAPGDAVVTDAASQVEISLGPYTRVDIDKNSEVIFDKVSAREGDRMSTELYQKSGISWYRVAQTAKGERFKVVTQTVVVSPSGANADFMIEVTPTMVRVHGLEGILLVERTGGEEVLNLMAGQSLSVYGNRPFQVTPRPSDVNAAQRFADLRASATAQTGDTPAPVNFIFCTVPSTYYFISVRFDTKSVTAVRLPPETSVEQYAQGFTTLNEAYLLGGPMFVLGLVEQIMGTRAERYTALMPDALRQLMRLVGSVTVQVDQKAADAMGLGVGPQRLEGDQILQYLKPGISGPEGARRRQEQVLQGLFNELRSGNLALTAALAERATSVMKTNFSITEIVSSYTRFSASTGWVFTTNTIPGAMQQAGRRSVFQADAEAARRMLFGG